MAKIERTRRTAAGQASLGRARVERVTPSGWRRTAARSTPMPWFEVAVDPAVTDLDFLGKAVTLARLEWSASADAERAEWGRRHDALWIRLRSLARAGSWNAPAEKVVRDEQQRRSLEAAALYKSPEQIARERRGTWIGVGVVTVIIVGMIAAIAMAAMASRKGPPPPPVQLVPAGVLLTPSSR